MDKATLTISLPRTMKVFIKGKLRKARLSTPSEDIRSLIRIDQDMTRKGGVALVRRNALRVETAARPSGSTRRRKKTSPRESMETRPFQILLAEDSKEDAELVRMALKEHNVQCTLHLIRDGAKAIELINGFDSDPHAPPLDLCLLDMHLPKRGGDEVLKRLRSTEHYAQTPVIVMSGINGRYVEEAAAENAALVYFQKPSTLDEYLRLGSIAQNLLRKRPGAA